MSGQICRGSNWNDKLAFWLWTWWSTRLQKSCVWMRQSSSKSIKGGYIIIVLIDYTTLVISRVNSKPIPCIVIDYILVSLNKTVYTRYLPRATTCLRYICVTKHVYFSHCRRDTREKINVTKETSFMVKKYCKTVKSTYIVQHGYNAIY